VGNFWLDACEPGLSPEAAARAVYAAGPAAEAVNLYTTGAHRCARWKHQRCSAQGSVPL